MSARNLFLVLGCILFLSSCQKEVFILNEEVSIGYNSSVVVQTNNSSSIKVKYTDLLEEARCPHTADCLDPGYVRVQLKLDKEHIELGLGTSTSDSIVYNNNVIHLLAVEYESMDDFGTQSKSSIVIRVD